MKDDEDISMDEKREKVSAFKEKAAAVLDAVRPEVTALAGAAMAQGARALIAVALTAKRKKAGDRHE